MTTYNIYKMYNNNKTYFGLTSNNIYIRLGDHLRNFKRYKKNNLNPCASYEVFNDNLYNVKIKLMETITGTHKEAMDRETYYINNYDCVNIRQKIKNKIEIEKKYKLKIEIDLNELLSLSGLSLTETINAEKLKNCECLFKLNESLTTKHLIGKINTLLKTNNLKVKCNEIQREYKRFNVYKLQNIEDV